MRWLLEDGSGRCTLDNLAHVHHAYVVAHSADYSEIVSDHDDSHLELLLQLDHEIEDLGLDGHVERGGRLIGYQQARVARQRHRDHRTLAHSSAQLVWVLLDPL